MFKKWFGGNKTPTNSGNPESDGQLEGQNWKKVFELELSNMEDSPSYSLTHQLTIGSEIGNIIIDDPSVSPRHATFILQQEIVSVIDHASVAGTIVNGKKITPGKYIILEETDIVAIGDLEVRLKVASVAVPVENVPEFHEESKKVEAEPEPEPEPPKTEPSKVPLVKIAPVVSKVVVNQHGIKGKGKGKLNLSLKSYTATNSLVRVLALLGDLLLSYAIIQIFSPFDDFRDFLTLIPKELGILLDVDWDVVWSSLTEDHLYLQSAADDLFKFFAETFHVGNLFLVFIIIRIFTTFMFGVSISEVILGVRANGNKIWSRIGGVLRVIFGIFTGPFLIFDAPAIVSKRTFKEFMTFTNTYLDSKFIAILGGIFYLPLLIAINLVAPLYQGLEIPEAIFINDKIDQRVRVVKKDANLATAVDPASIVTHTSKFFGLELPYSPAELTLLPEFRFQGFSKKMSYVTSLTFYHEDIQRKVQMELFKKFDLRQLLSIPLKSNFFLFERFPDIYSFVYESSNTNKSFKKVVDAKSQMRFASEVIDLIKLSLELDEQNVLEVMQTTTPLIKGLVDFRASLLSLIEYKDFKDIRFVKLGNVTFIKVSYVRMKPFDLLIPLVKGEGRVIKVSFDKREKLNEISNKFYKFTLAKSNWTPATVAAPMGEVMNPLEAFDFFAQLNLKKREIDPALAQALYGFYFERSASVLAQSDAVEYELWKSSINSIVKVFEKVVKIKASDSVESPSVKLLQNFKQMEEAVDSKNVNYFAPGQTI